MTGSALDIYGQAPARFVSIDMRLKIRDGGGGTGLGAVTYMKLGAKPYSLRDHVWGKNHINVKNTQQDFCYLGGKALRAPLYSGGRNGLSPPKSTRRA